MLSVLIYGTASAEQASETGGGWGTELANSYIRSLLKVRRRDKKRKTVTALQRQTDRAIDLKG